MMLKKLFIVVLSTIITSFYFFPFEFTFLPAINTKMAMAGLGVIILGFQMVNRRRILMDKDMFLLFIGAFLISLVSWVAIAYNDTKDLSFTTYFISFWVWLSGAYVVSLWLKKVHGYLSMELVVNYLVLVCTIQCLLALIMNIYTPLMDIVDSFVGGNNAFMGKAEGRLYGIGCALDVAGLRFSAVLVMIAYICTNSSQTFIRKRMGWYIGAFLIIAAIGNMIARTTTMGLVLALLYWFYTSGLLRLRYRLANNTLWIWLVGILIFFIPVAVYLYDSNQIIHDNIRFAFEGFFSLWETGKWEVQSNDILFEHMVVYPETLKTWIIGDGYAANPSDVNSPYYDPNYMGEIYHGYYKGTDIGYLRYIFYFGLVGLATFIAFFCKAVQICVKKFPLYRLMFLLFLLVNLIGWFKVTSDIFPVFALFLVINNKDYDIYNERIELEK